MSTTFPFDLINLWIRPYHGTEQACMFCQQPVTHTMHHAVDMFSRLQSSGLLDIDTAWHKAMQKQMSGDYSFAYYQPVCEECVQHFAAIQLGKRRPIQQLLTIAEIARKQRGMEFSIVIGCTVKSFDDEGDTWAMNVPNTTIEDVVRHIAENHVKE